MVLGGLVFFIGIIGFSESQIDRLKLLWSIDDKFVLFEFVCLVLTLVVFVDFVNVLVDDYFNVLCYFAVDISVKSGD